MKKVKLSKKAKIIIIVCVVVAVVGAIIGVSVYYSYKFGWGITNRHDKTEFAEGRELIEFRDPFTADYIWIEENGIAVWAGFTKEITLDSDSDAVLDISCDTHYWLWVNGEEVVWEGSLKRGVTPTDGYYDRITINGKFKAGKNKVSVLVRHLGDDGYSHKDSGHGGLVIQGKIGDAEFVTDGSWKAKKFAYDYSLLYAVRNTNFRLSERGSVINGEEYCEFWKDDSDASWGNAVVLDKNIAEVFGRSYLNPLPQKVVDDVRYFDISEHTATTKRTTTITLSLDVNSMFCPYFEFESDKAGRKITYYTENKKFDYINTYTAKQGENAFLDFAWINGEKLIVKLEKGITLKKIGYRKTYYGATVNENGFTSSDSDLNTLWQKAVNTLLVTMRDTYMDCPDRERAQWIADAVTESEMSVYALSPESSALFRKAIVSTYGWVHKDGVIQTVVPDGVEAYELPLQNLVFLVGCVNYMQYTGDLSVKPMVISMAKGYLPLWEMDGGLVSHRKGSWDWGDWGTKIDMTALENAWYKYALNKIYDIADTDAELREFCKTRMDSISAAYSKFYTSKGIASGKEPDDRANAVAVLAGLYRAEDVETITQTLYNTRNASPYMEKYVEEALCKLGRVDLALSRAKEVYRDMIDNECTTLWEAWDKDVGTTNHAWAGGTLAIIAKYVVGVNPTSPGFATYEVAPNLTAIKDYSLNINPTEDVKISVKSEAVDGKRVITVTSATEGGTLVINGKNCVFNGESVVSDQKSTYKFTLKAGENILVFDE